jgi:hypothetical protein
MNYHDTMTLAVLAGMYPAPLDWRSAPSSVTDAELLAYCKADIEITDRFRRLMAWHALIERRVRRATLRFEEDGILPAALHDDSMIWEPRETK